mmetsp:Transcript_18082/g.39542  ORF Transcript_18082/g.39542 Transcript_18082/m.39542 type:complete len:204 (-) Transcript_18082:1587-2198(-)
MNELGMHGRGAEIGVGRGKFADEILSTWDCEEYHLVDRRADQFAGLRARFANRLQLDKGRSSQVVRQFPDHHFDFVYVGGGNSYDQVLRDMTDWYPKVRPGGLVAGHNYCVSRAQRRQRLASALYGGGRDGLARLARRPWCGPLRHDAPEGGAEKVGNVATVRAADQLASQCGRKLGITLEGRKEEDPYNSKGFRNPSWWFFK